MNQRYTVMAKSTLIRFDWAMKRLLRNKSNFVVLEGFLSTLLEDDIHIVHILESEGNKKDAEDKFNRVDLLAENSRGELIIVEVQNNRELDYFHRMLYGTAKAVTEYLHEGERYGNIRKVYSISIIYFDLGQGKDYVYRGRTEFRGIHQNDILLLSALQQQFMRSEAADVFPEYYVLRVNEFDQKAVTPLDEWIEFLKTGEIGENVTAKGLPEARERLRRDKLSPEELRAYEHDLEAIRYQRSVIDTGREEGRQEGRLEGKLEGKIEGKMEGRQEAILDMARKMKQNGIEPQLISQCTGLPVEEISKL